ncbi:G-type lectin S-receptor-like serine/threonine-protein kinase At4g27290 [Euphorbia lathyris]|uniref:G-type lectin S-receptor-like serine/threonine-protein kinase At4g27290 n=1 Tax=Euphorbia lathyris TaxID=212925 RepID=UPI003313DC0A
MELGSFLVLCANLLFFLSKLGYATDILSSFDSLTDDGTTLVSKDGSFKLGFFSPDASSNRYIGIWYGKISVQTVVWVANRNQPINDSSGLLMIDRASNLVLLSRNRTLQVWSSNSTKQAQSPLVQLLDSGNLVIKEANSENYVWQSFDYPSDTILPEMKFGWDMRTGLNRRWSAWKNWDDPSPGDLNLIFEQYDYPESVIWKGNKKIWRSGPWNGIAMSGAEAPRQPGNIYQQYFVSNENEVYFVFYPLNKSMLIRETFNQSLSTLQFYIWDEAGKTWMMFWSVPNDICESYSYCGTDGHCIINETPTCQCLKGFSPASQQNLYSGCVRNNMINCSNGEGFVKFNDLRLPDTETSWVNSSMNLEECRAKCLQNCSCMAYANSDLRGKGSGCVIWFGGLMDMKKSQFGQELYVRMSALDLEASKGTKRTVIIILATLIPVTFMMLVIGCFIHRRRRRVKLREKTKNDEEENDQEDLELPLIDLSEILKATNKFSMDNKLGEGGFGPVYKGILADGQEIAVKRLSKSSGQGLHEFKNEVILIAKLQHRNLVRLLGCCIQGDEKLLVYEFMPNKSLDFFIFDKTASKQLDWSMRHKIICGIAKGLLYLHQDSRLRIIHRDLKASNVLLDNQMNPKISDFGLARMFGGDQTEGTTNRVVGTYGYMAPEYAADGLFSVKSDVFSFGVLMIEIISGTRSRGFYQPNHSHNLVAYAWRMWKEGKYLELVDSSLGESCHLSQLMRCVHISLLCVQQNAEERPSMEFVVLMLSSEIKLPQPKEPGYYRDKGPVETESSSSRINESTSTNEYTYSLPEPRLETQESPYNCHFIPHIHIRLLSAVTMTATASILKTSKACIYAAIAYSQLNSLTLSWKNIHFNSSTMNVHGLCSVCLERYATDILSSFDSLTDNGTTLVSKDGSFKLGFFSPDASSNRYIGIWYGKISVQTVVWVANRNQPINNSSERTKNDDEENDHEDLELPLIDLNEILKATNTFSMENKLGEGGLGPVYKGVLEDGQEIAVKRLSKSSGQGLHELKNEVILIAKLQHRNLVRLLGCCIQGDEKLLVYEFMPNKSLDFFIFDQTASKQLDWSMRHKIICGIAKGLLYLHQDSRLRIIHRDLKASNVLLDNQMNPKISDFGLARIFGGDQTEGTTNRVVGTYGYMAPEYAADGLFSVKSDVFSFGVLMIEIISGTRSRGFYQRNHSHNLVAYAWRMWKEGKYLELVDSALGESCHLSQLIRYIHISLLCVQQNAEQRPSMESVVLMLSSEIKLPQPKEPGYYRDKGPVETESSSSKINESTSTNEYTYSLPEPR